MPCIREIGENDRTYYYKDRKLDVWGRCSYRVGRSSFYRSWSSSWLGRVVPYREFCAWVKIRIAIRWEMKFSLQRARTERFPSIILKRKAVLHSIGSFNSGIAHAQSNGVHDVLFVPSNQNYVKNSRPIRNGGLKKTVFLNGFLWRIGFFLWHIVHYSYASFGELMIREVLAEGAVKDIRLCKGKKRKSENNKRIKF